MDNGLDLLALDIQDTLGIPNRPDTLDFPDTLT